MNNLVEFFFKESMWIKTIRDYISTCNVQILDQPEEDRGGVGWQLVLDGWQEGLEVEAVGRLHDGGHSGPTLNPGDLKKNMLDEHMFLRQISTIKSVDRGKRGYFGNHKVISYHLQLTRGAQPSGQSSLYLLNDINSLWSEFTKVIIALAVGHF